MKRFSQYMYALVLAIALSTTVGCASSAKHEGTGEHVDDTVVTARVKAAIFNDATLKVAEINVETFKGVVQLSGFVSSLGDITKAGQLAKTIPGVSSVKNDIRLK